MKGCALSLHQQVKAKGEWSAIWSLGEGEWVLQLNSEPAPFLDGVLSTSLANTEPPPVVI